MTSFKSLCAVHDVYNHRSQNLLHIFATKRSIQLTSAGIGSKMSDFDVDLHKKVQKSIQRDKQGRYDVSRRGKLATVLKDINDNVLLTEFIIVCLVNMDVNDIVDHFNGENPIIPQWKDGQKLKFDEFLAFSMATIMKKKHDNDSDSEDEEPEDLFDSDVEGDPGVKALKRLVTLEGFGIKNPTDFPSLQDKTDLKRAVNAAPVDPSMYLPRVDAVKSAQDILNIYEAILYFEDQAYKNRLESLKSYTLAPEDTKEMAPTDRRDPTLTYEFISDEEGDEVDEVDEYYGRRKKVQKKKLPHNLMIKNKKKDENRRARLPRAQFTINV